MTCHYFVTPLGRSPLTNHVILLVVLVVGTAHTMFPYPCLLVCLLASFDNNNNKTECNAQPPSIDEYDEYLAEAQSVVQGFEQALSDAAVVLAGECNVTNTSSVEANVSTLFASVCSSVLLLRNIRNAFSCQTWLPLYYTAVYDALCYNGTNGVWAIAATQFVVVVMACLIMTFRAVFWDLKIMDDRPKDDDEEDDDSGNHEKGGEQPQERSIEAPPPPVAGVAVEEDASPEADRDAGVVPPQGLSTVEVY